MTADGDSVIAGLRALRAQNTVLTVALFLLVSLQTFELIRARASLTAARTAQEQTVQQSVQMRRQLDALAKGTARLAAEGNANARTIVEDFRRQGVALGTEGVPP